MNIRRTIFHPLRSFFGRHILSIVVLVGLFWIGYIGWLSWKAQPDLPLPPERITSKQIKVNEKQRLELEEKMKSYHQPTPRPNLTNVHL